MRKTKTAREWRLYEAWDNNFHRAIAAAARNKLFNPTLVIIGKFSL